MPQTYVLNNDGSLRLWDSASNATLNLGTFHFSGSNTALVFFDVAVAPDGQVYAVGGSSIYHLDLETHVATSLYNSYKAINALEINAAGQFIVGYSSRDFIEVIDQSNFSILAHFDTDPTAGSLYGGPTSSGDLVLEGNILYFAAKHALGTSQPDEIILYDMASGTIIDRWENPLAATTFGLYYDNGLIGFVGNTAYRITAAGYTPLYNFDPSWNVFGASHAIATALSGGADTFLGTGLANLISGLAGNDTISALQGNDTVYGGDGHDVIYAGEGNDTVDGGNGRDLVFLNQGNDLYIDNTQGGDLGRDTVFAGLGNDTIQGGNGDDVFRGEAGDDLIYGRLGNDLIYGGDQFDTIHGGEGNDTVDGGNGRDLIFLNQGNDVYFDNAQGGVSGRDTVYAGLGNDTIQGGNGDDVFYGEAGNDRIFARLGNDTVYAGDQFDFIDAGDGNDLVFGGNGGDRIFLGNGNDVYVDTAQTGAFGQDTITGGAGVDRFEFQAVMSDDMITDFQVGVDELRLTQSLWGGGLSAAQVVSTYASVTAGGVLFDFGAGQSILLQGLNSLAGLDSDILLG